MARTPALLVPNTPEGKFYNALPDVAPRIAEAIDRAIRQAAPSAVDLTGHPLFSGSKEALTQLLLNAINAWSFDDVKQRGFQATAQLIASLPIFPSDDAGEIVDFSQGKTPVEVLARRLPNGLYRFPVATSYALLGRVVADWDRGTYLYLSELGGPEKIFYSFEYGVCFSEQVAYWMTANPPVGLFGLSATTKVMSQLAERLDRSQSSGGAWEALGPQQLLSFTAQKFIQATGLTDINDLSFESNVGEQFYIGDFAQGEGITYAYLIWVNNAWRFVTIGQATGLKAFLQSAGPLLKIASIALAFYGIGAALASISSGGATVLNVAQLTASVDNLPGVDLGVVGDIASGVTTGINLSEKIGTTAMDDFYDIGDIGSFDVIDPGAFDITLTLEDIGANVVDFDDSIFAGLGLDATDLLPDEFGNVFTVTGEAVALDPETYVKTIYLDEFGNYRDFSNEVVLSKAEADIAFNERGLDEDVANALAEKVRGLSGSTFVAQPGSDNRPDGTPAPAAQGERPFFQTLSQEVMSWFKTVTSYSLAKEQLEKTGRYTPPYQTNPNGTPYSQVPGVPIKRADGSTVINNGNGTQTIAYPDGRVQTVPTSLNPGQFAGGQLIPGLSNQTLLIAGGALLAVALLSRR